MRYCVLSALIMLVSVQLLASSEATSPVGIWMTIDDSTNKPRSYVQIYEEKGELKGKILKVFPRPGEEENPVCVKCKGEKNGKRAVGLEIMWGMKKDGSEWNGGFLMDPDNGETYKGFLEIAGWGKKLKVRGYIGISLFGRTQVWLRQDETILKQLEKKP